jgi:hypothetical protein
MRKLLLPRPFSGPMPQAMTAAPWPPLVRAFAATAGRAAAQRALPVYVGLWIAASVLFEGNGVRPADVVAGALASRGERLLLYAAWTVVSLPAIRALLTTPSSFFLRTLPVPRWQLLTVHGAGVLLAQLPWAYLWLRGGGLALGCSAIAAGIAASTLALTRLEQRSERLAAIGLAGAVSVNCPWPLLLAVSLPAAALGVQRVWLRAPEGRADGARGWVGGPAAVALAASYGVLLWRQSRAQLARAVGFASIAFVAAYFAVRNTLPASSAELVALATALLSPALILGLAALSGPLLRVEAQLGWLLAVCGTSRWTEQLARIAPLAALAASLAAAHASLLAAWLPTPLALGLRLLLVEVAAALLLSPLVSWVGRWALRADGSDSIRLLLGVATLLLGTSLSLTLLGALALWGWAALACLSLIERGRPQRLALTLQARLER